MRTYEECFSDINSMSEEEQLFWLEEAGLDCDNF